jgi:hypothetical protein
MFETGELFGVKDTKTGKEYDNPYYLVEDMKEDLPDIYKIFRPYQFYLDDEGDLYIEGNSPTLSYLDRERFVIVWNLKHTFFKDYPAMGFIKELNKVKGE